MEEKKKDLEKKAEEFVEKYPLTEDEAFEPNPTSEHPVDYDVVYKDGIINQFDTRESFKQIDDGVYALPIDTVGSIVAMDGSMVFVPEVGLTETPEGLKLIRIKKFRG
jgi:hypothetical protein